MDENGFHLVPHVMSVYERLLKLPTERQVGFAAACSERLYPDYAQLCRRHGTEHDRNLHAILDRVWRHALGDTITQTCAARLLEDVESLETWEHEPDASVVGTNTLACAWAAVSASQADAAVHATKAARLLDDTVFQEVSDHYWGDSRGIAEPEKIDEIVELSSADSRMQAVWAWQDRLLDFLSSIDNLDEKAHRLILRDLRG